VKYFHHQNDDVRFWTDHAHWDAEHGRVRLAIQRLEELAAEFPNNAHIAYDQGLLWNHHTGNGRRAREYFLAAERMASEQKVKGTQWYAARYLAKLVDTPDESRRWSELVLSLAPRSHPDRVAFSPRLNPLETGADYGELLWVFSTQSAGLKEYGTASAIAEIALSLERLAPGVEAARRRNRAEWLRMLDRTEEQQRSALVEIFPPEDRLALMEGVAEIDRALAADPYDAVMWNLNAGWRQSLGRNEQAIQSAEKAIELRPLTYSRPWVNKAAALYELKRDEEALECARRALEVARSGGAEFADDIEKATRQIQIMSQPRRDDVLTDLAPIMSQAVAAAMASAEEAMARKTTPEFLANGIRTRIRATGSGTSISYVPMMAQFFSDFSPEVAFVTVFAVSAASIPDYVLCMNAAMYLAADSSGVVQRDATRLLLLVLFSRMFKSPDFVRQIYREAVLEVCRNAKPPLSQLDEILRTEMVRFHPAMPHLITDHEPLTDQENDRGRRSVEVHFTGDPHEFEMDAPQIGDAVTNDPDMWALTRRFKYWMVKFRRWWMLISGPAGRKPPTREH